MPIHIYNAKQQKITLEDTPLGFGGEGNIHRIIAPATYQNCCVKLYFDQYRTPQKEQKTIFQASNPPPNLANTNFIVCWPQEVVYQNQQFAGFVMPLAYANSQQLYALCLPNISPNANATLRQKYDRSTQQGMVNRFKLCVNIASAIHLIHATQQYVLVDLKPQNILFTHDGKIAVTDIDSVQISQTPRNVLHHAAVATPEYTPTEGHTGILNPAQHYIPQSWDDFSLAVLFYELLMGVPPYAATFGGAYSNQNTIAEKIQNGLFVHGSKVGYATVIPPLHQYYAQLPAALQSLFYAAFETGHNYPQQRPTAEQWGYTLHNTLQNTQHIQQHTQTVPQPNVKVVTPPVQNAVPPNVFVQPALPPNRITLLNARTINFGLGTIHTRPITLPRPQVNFTRYKGITIIAFLVLLAWLLKDPVSNYFAERARVQAEQEAKVARVIAEKQRVQDSIKVANEKLQQVLSEINQNMVYVKGGTFMMGRNDEIVTYVPSHDIEMQKIDKQTLHKVSLSDFKISKYEVTKQQYYCIMQINKNTDINEGGYPIELSWNDSEIFLNKLNSLTGKKYRLPTEAEWEYAGIGGQNTQGYIFSGSNDSYEVGWLGTINNNVGLKKANELGLYDMTGNAAEWCSDWYSEIYHKELKNNNPKGPNKSSSDPYPIKVVRGGSYTGLYSTRHLVRGRSWARIDDEFGNKCGIRLVND